MKALLSLLIVVFALGACTPIRGIDDIIGSYNLVSVDGNPLPYNPAHEAGSPEIIASTLKLDPDGTFQMTMTVATTPGTQVSRDMKGIYTLDQALLTFDWEGAGITPATYEASTITLENEGLLFLYQR